LKKKSEIQEPTFKDLVILYRLKNDPSNPNNKSAIYIKSFRNIPMADLETIFPSVKFTLRTTDTIYYTIAAALGILTLIINLTTDSTVLQTSSLASFVALAFKVYMDYKVQIYYYQSDIINLLYNKSESNYKGALLNLMHSLKIQEIKEVLLSYFILNFDGPQTKEDMDKKIEDFLVQVKFHDKEGDIKNFKIDFDAHHAVKKLIEIGLAEETADKHISVVPIDTALEKIISYSKQLLTKKKKKK